MIGGKPALGVNVPWLGDSYGHDFGRNASYPDWPADFDWWRTDRLFALLRSRGIVLLRCWLFEDAEGLLVDERGQVTGVDPLFLENLAAFVRLADKWGMLVLWTLLDANSVRRRPDMTTRAILTDPLAAQRFIDKALDVVLPVIVRVAWAIDLCNEPEAIVAGGLGNGTGLGFDWWAVTPQLALLCHAVRHRRARLAVTVGSGFQEHRCLAAGRYDGLPLDMLSYHAHAHGADTVLPPASDISASSPVILGELGWPMPGGWPKNRDSWEKCQLRLTERMKQAITAGYSAIFLWFISDIVGNGDTLVNAGDVGRPLELVAPFQASGSIAAADEIVPFPTLWQRQATDLAGCDGQAPDPHHLIGST